MGKCEHVIEKGKRKNQICGIYTNKIIDNKNYCSSHMNSHKPKQEPIKQEPIKQEPIKQEPIKQEPIIIKEEPIKQEPIIIKEEPKIIRKKSLSNGDSLDDVINYEYSKLNDNDDNKKNNKNYKIYKKLDDLSNRLFFIENHLKYGKNNALNIPEFEVFR
jgi:hypothetical protein